MTITEAARQAHMLAGDQTSWTFAALHGWERPASPEFLALADLYDAFASVKFKKPEPYPRPWPTTGKQTESFGAPVAPAEMPDVLRAFGRDPAATAA